MKNYVLAVFFGGWQMNQNLVNFKGNQEGIYIYIKEGNFQLIKEQLESKLKKAGTFFNGAKLINIKGKRLSAEEVDELKVIINDKYGLSINEVSQDEQCETENIIKSEEKKCFSGIHEGQTKFIHTTIRSGQSIEYSGNVVIVGDINPGGLVTATGNIIVLGALRGVAHAGSDGNRQAVVAAFYLHPTQLRIADVITRRPDYEIEESKWPEIARIRDDAVLIEPYLPKK